jgi:two-component system, LytTR family, response regulator LytT
LLKPFSYEKLVKAVAKAFSRLGVNQTPISQTISEVTILIKSEGKTYPVKLHNILYCESIKNYTKIFLKNGERLLPLTTLSKLENDLKNSNNDFIKFTGRLSLTKLMLPPLNEIRL